jgi:hypothetical protein
MARSNALLYLPVSFTAAFVALTASPKQYNPACRMSLRHDPCHFGNNLCQIAEVGDSVDSPTVIFVPAPSKADPVLSFVPPRTCG